MSPSFLFSVDLPLPKDQIQRAWRKSEMFFAPSFKARATTVVSWWKANVKVQEKLRHGGTQV